MSLYPSGMWDENSIYSKIETDYAFTDDMNDEIVEKIDSKLFTRGSVFLKSNMIFSSDLIVQHLPDKAKLRKLG